jgi:hypothetical protein
VHSHGLLDHPQQLAGSVGGSDAELLEELHCEWVGKRREKGRRKRGGVRMRPQKRLKVRGRRVVGETEKSTFFWVRTKTPCEGAKGG